MGLGGLGGTVLARCRGCAGHGWDDGCAILVIWRLRGGEDCEGERQEGLDQVGES